MKYKRAKLSLFVASLALIPLVQAAEPDAQKADPSARNTEEHKLVVVGFRESLDRAESLKRNIFAAQ